MKILTDKQKTYKIIQFKQMEFLKIFVLNWSLENKMLTDEQTNKPSETHQFQKTPSYLIGVLVTHNLLQKCFRINHKFKSIFNVAECLL